MANANRPRGLSPVRHLNGSPWNGAMNIYYHSTADAVAIYKGAIVHTDAGLTAPSSDPLSTYQCIVTLTDGDADIVGVAWAFGTTPNLLTQVGNLNAVDYCPASTGMYIGVIDDPNVIFSIQDSGTALTQAALGMNADISGNTGGTAATGRSTATLDATPASATKNLKIMRLVPRDDNSLLANADFEVIFNEHVHKDAEPLTT